MLRGRKGNPAHGQSCFPRLRLTSLLVSAEPELPHCPTSLQGTRSSETKHPWAGFSPCSRIRLLSTPNLCMIHGIIYFSDRRSFLYPGTFCFKCLTIQTKQTKRERCSSWREKEVLKNGIFSPTFWPSPLFPWGSTNLGLQEGQMQTQIRAILFA